MQRSNTLNRTVMYLKREKLIAEDTIKIQRFIITVLAGVLLATIIVYSMNLTKAREMLSTTTKQNTYLSNEIEALTTSNNELVQDLTAMTQVSLELESQNNLLINDNKALAEEYDEVYAELSKLQAREELYDRYSYAIIYDGHRTDVKYDALKHLEDIAEELGMTQDSIDLCLSFVLNESRGNENAYNASGASGLGQLMPGTGKFVWDKLMDNKGIEYDHSTIPFDGSTNLEMTLRLLDYLGEYYNNDTKDVITSYCGGYMQGYVNSLNIHLSKGPTPTTVEEMKILKE